MRNVKTWYILVNFSISLKTYFKKQGLLITKKKEGRKEGEWGKGKEERKGRTKLEDF